jgi:ribosomal-protein-alanine N-acetyltransferase
LNIRPATPEDIPSIMQIEQASASAAHWGEQRYRDMFSNSAPRRLTLVVEELGIAGFLVAASESADWEIENVVIQEGARRRGMGRALILDLLARARKENANSVQLEVRESNVPARQLYLNLGFRQIARRPRYYSHPEEDAILYLFETL